MAVENPQYINEFNPAWPDGLDSKSQGDDHMRNIKAALLRTFPNVKGPVNATHQQLSKLANPGATVDPGLIMAWAFGIDTIPAGWKVCNGVGKISTGQNVPNLLDRTIVGAGLSYSPGSIGGATGHGHTSVITVEGTALDVSQIPAHSHNVPVGTNDTTGTGDGSGNWRQVAPGNSGGTNAPSFHIATANQGAGGIHTHGASANIGMANHMMPYMALLWVIKD